MKKRKSLCILYTGAFVKENNILRETASGAECVVEYPLFYINIGDTCNKEMGFKYFGWFRNAKRHRQDTKNLVELISKIIGMCIHIK